MFIKAILFIIGISNLVLHANNFSPMTDNQIQGRLNIVNGYSAECVMHKFYENSGWMRIEGEVGRNGIDGLYYKKKDGVIREVLVSESKWNKSQLGKSGKNKLVRQMSKTWVLRTIDKLQRYKPLPEYKRIKKFVLHGNYRARLFRLFPRSKNRIQIQIFKIRNKGDNNYSIHIDQKLPPIAMDHPNNTFEQHIIEAYNGCRAKALQKYFPMLKQNKIDQLLNDNYLQRNDIKLFIEQQAI